MAKKKSTSKSRGTKNVGLFFGAGAEIDYGLPSGGKFAIEIFRRSPTEQKSRFKQLLSGVDRTTQYAANFLPHEFHKKNINVFGKPDFTSLLRSSIEYRREDVLRFLNSFDDNAVAAMSAKSIDIELFKEKYAAATGKEFGSSNYSSAISLNEKLGDESGLFSSSYFSAFLDVLAMQPGAELLRRCATSFLQLLVGCCSQRLASNLNDQLFTETPDNVGIFDDVVGVFQIEFSQAGLAALEIVLGSEDEAVDEDSSLEVIAGQICRATLEKLFEKCLDYQALIDSHFRYLYEPHASWAKFTKICIFLNVVRDYIIEGMPPADTLRDERDGYYHDLLKMKKDNLIAKWVGTTNYTDLIQTICGKASPDVAHLNGAISDFYDPYLNRIVELLNPEEEYVEQGRVLVPMLFTQSGIKPLTSIEMSRRYVDLFDHFKACDAVVVIGFGFNGDDGHINCLFRELIQVGDKPVFVLDLERPGVSDSKILAELGQKLRLEKRHQNLHYIGLTNDRMTSDGKLWYEAIAERVQKHDQINLN